MTTIEEFQKLPVNLPIFNLGVDFTTLAHPLAGLKVSLARQEYGSALTLELGQLVPSSGPRRYLRGEASLMMGMHWRFEMESGVAFGSSSSSPFIYAQLAELRGQTVTGIYLERRLPELVVELNGGLRAHTLSCGEGDPYWCLWLPDKSSLHWEAGALRHEQSGRG